MMAAHPGVTRATRIAAWLNAFDRNDPVQSRIACLPHFAHSAGADWRDGLRWSEACGAVGSEERSIYVEKFCYRCSFVVPRCVR
jgi:hypothetical protein